MFDDVYLKLLVKGLIETCIKNVGELWQSNFGKEVIYEIRSSDEEGLKEEEDAVKDHLRKRAQSLKMGDFGLDDADQDENDSDGQEMTIQGILTGKKDITQPYKDGALEGTPLDAYEKIKKDFSALSKEEKMNVVYRFFKGICKDGGIFKKILKEGEKWENPKDLDEVFIKYEAHLEDGIVISKSEGAEFTIKGGLFCPTLAKAVKTMKKGEKAILTMKPQYAFSEKGRAAFGDEGSVLPNATLLVELELVSWKTEVGDDKKILKKIIKEGEGYECPNDGVVVKVKLIGKLLDGMIFVKKGQDEEEPSEFKTDEEQVIGGLEILS